MGIEPTFSSSTERRLSHLPSNHIFYFRANLILPPGVISKPVSSSLIDQPHASCLTGYSLKKTFFIITPNLGFLKLLFCSISTLSPIFKFSSSMYRQRVSNPQSVSREPTDLPLIYGGYVLKEGIAPSCSFERTLLRRLRLLFRHSSLVPKRGLEPLRPFGHSLLRRICLPFHHSGIF